MNSVHKTTTRYCKWLVCTCLGLCQKVRRIVIMLQCSLRHYVDIGKLPCKYANYDLCNYKTMIYYHFHVLNDSKVTPSVLPMDVSRLGSNIITSKNHKYAHQYAN